MGAGVIRHFRTRLEGRLRQGPSWLTESLQTRLILLVGGVFLVSLFSFVLALTHHFESDLKRQTAIQQWALVNYMADEIESKLQLRLDSLNLIAERLPSPLPPPSEQEDFLKERRAIYNLFDFGLVVIRPDLHGAWADYPVVPGRRTADWDIAPVRQVLESGRAAVGSPETDRFCNKPMVVLAVPVKDPAGKITAVLGGFVSLGAPYFLDSINRPQQYEVGRMQLLAPQNRLMLTAQEPFSRLLPMPQPGQSALLDRLIHHGTSVIDQNEYGEEEMASAKRVPSSGWMVMARIPTGRAFAEVRQHLASILLLAAALAVMVAWIAALLIRHTLRPIHTLVTDLDAITRGEQPLTPLPIEHPDEVGRLTESINHLQVSLNLKEIALRENETRLRTLIEALPDAIQFKDGQGRWLIHNTVAQTLFGLQGVECQGLRDADLARQTQPGTATILQRSILSDETVWAVCKTLHMEERMPDASGNERIFNVTKIPLCNADGAREGLVVIARDITETRQITSALENSLKEFNGLVERIPVAVFKFRALGRGRYKFDYVSPRWEEMLGTSAELAYQDAMACLARIHPDDLERFMLAVENACHSHHAFAQEVRLLDERGERWLYIEASSHPQGNGVFLWEGIQYDITARKQAEERLRLVDYALDHVNEAAFMADEAGRFALVNAATCRTLGYDKNELLHLKITDIDADTNEATWRRSWVRIQQIGSALFESHHRHKSGELIPVEINASHFTYQGQPYILGLARNISERKRAESHQKLTASVFTNTQEGIVITSANATIIDVNEAFTRLTGFPREEVIGRNPSLLRSGHQTKEYYQGMWQSLQETGHWSGEIWNRRKNGELYAERLSISSVEDDQGRTSHYVGVFSDITHIKEHQRQLEQIAHYDPLTSLPNRLLLTDRLRQGIAKTQRSQDLMAICYLDLDGFKAVNDTHGHEAGDLLLVEMAHRFRACLRGEDTVARLGGDEFVLLLLGLKAPGEADVTLHRILETVAQPVYVNALATHVSASIGVTIYPLDNDSPDTLLRHADQAMYVAKQSGKNHYRVFDPDSDRQARVRQSSQTRIQEALEREELILFYQPKVNMHTGVVIGVEALLRWQHPERGLIMPGEFLPAIENTDLIVNIGHWVIDTALAQLENWHRAGLNLGVSVNVAARQLLKPDFIEHLSSSLARHPQLIPGHVELEVLETSALEDIGRISDVISTCSHLGIGFSLDDFGTGYSSLAYLKQLQADTLKIDQSFIRGMLRDTEDLAIVEGIIGLSEVFRREVIAEGVETDEHGVLLINLGCELAQGYAIAQAMPAHQLIDWIRHWQPCLVWKEAGGFRLPREDLPLIIAEYDHRRWVDTLTDLVEGLHVHEPPVMNPHECRFGRRYDRAAHSHYRRRPEYLALGPIHERVHELGQEILDLLETGQRNQARQRLQDLYNARDELVHLLHQLLGGTP